jgi:hypothetical protein
MLQEKETLHAAMEGELQREHAALSEVRSQLALKDTTLAEVQAQFERGTKRSKRRRLGLPRLS